METKLDMVENGVSFSNCGVFQYMKPDELLIKVPSKSIGFDFYYKNGIIKVGDQEFKFKKIFEVKNQNVYALGDQVLTVHESRYTHCSGIYMNNIQVLLDEDMVTFKGQLNTRDWQSPDYCDSSYFDDKLNKVRGDQTQMIRSVQNASYFGYS